MTQSISQTEQTTLVTIEDAKIVEVETKITEPTPKELNEMLVKAGLWKSGCQFLSKADKLDLLVAKTKKQKDAIYFKLDAIVDSIKTKASDREYKHVFSEKAVANGVNVIGDINQLRNFMTPVKEDSVYFSNGIDMVEAPKHKAIVTLDGKIVSVMAAGYKLIRNEDVVLPLLEQLDKLDNNWFIDHTHSFMTANKMRLQITFPDLKFKDGESEIAMSLFITNSYDGSTALNVKWGAIRAICSNGMVFGRIFQDYYQRHNAIFSAGKLAPMIEDTYKQIPQVNERVLQLEQSTFKVTADFLDTVAHKMGKKAAGYLELQKVETEWEALNALTYYTSHYVNYKSRASQQATVSSLFEL